MCGIAGWLAAPGARVDRETLRSMALTLYHRGPDDAGEYLDAAGAVGLMHRRLSILDLSAASRQPMVAADTGEVLACSGEVYNYRDLRRELERRGRSFHTAGDTEVVLQALVEWGPEAFRRFAGMFAIAFWSPSERRLWLARDATGMRPLYLAELPGRGLVFASELKALLDAPGFRPEVDPRSLGQFLEFGYVFEGRRTMLLGVEKLLPGEVIEARDGAVARRFRHFDPPPAELEAARPAEERVSELYSTLGEVVREHLVAGVPVGLLLSGGIDSSLIAALAAREGPLTTVNMAVGRSEIDERAPARRAAAALGTHHQEIEIAPEQIVAEITAGAWVFDDLFADWGTVSTRMLYRRFRELGFKVALVGEGADELFGGYPVFEKAAETTGLLGRIRLYQLYAGRHFGRQFADFSAILERYLDSAGSDLFQAVRRFECDRQLPSNCAMKVDKASMSVSLEARAPFLDRRVAELAYRTPTTSLLRGGENKWLLREVARRYGLLPEEVTGRRKRGASIALSWLEEVPEFRDFARAVVLDPSGWCDELGLRRAMERYFGGKSGYPRPHSRSIFRNLVWRLLLLNLWSQHYLRRVLVSNAKSPGSVAVPWPGPARVEHERIPDLVSTIIPVHNRPELLIDAVESVLAQDHRPIEILIVDDGSADHTPAVAEQLATRHPEVVRCIHREQGGPGLARESGRRAARGEFLQHLDSDDLLLPRKFELQVAALRSNPEASAAYGITEEIHADGSVEPVPERPSNVRIERMFPTFLRLRWWHTSTPLYRAAHCDRIGPWTDLWLEEDWEYDCRIAALGAPVCFVPEVVSRHRHVAPQRLSRGEAIDARRLTHRARAHELILGHATRAGIPLETPDMRHYARELFLLARQCGAAGLRTESRRLFEFARLASTPTRRDGLDFRLYRVLCWVTGWITAGRLAHLIDALRSRPPGR